MKPRPALPVGTHPFFSSFFLAHLLPFHVLKDDLEPRHEGAIRQSASDVGRSTPSVREEPRDT